jgi:hypothetical protein
MAVGHMNKLHARNEAEAAVLVSDQIKIWVWEMNYSAVSSRLREMSG